MFFIIHSGQTGVERGAHHGALAAGLRIAGFMPPDRRDELGPLPADVAGYLTPFIEKGPRPALRANLEIASGVVVVATDVAIAHTLPTMSWLLKQIRARKLPLLMCDPRTSVADAASWAAQLPLSCGSRRLVVTGPRSTRWPQGESVARRLVTAIGMTGSDDTDEVTVDRLRSKHYTIAAETGHR